LFNLLRFNRKSFQEKRLIVCVKDVPREYEQLFDLERIYDGPELQYPRQFYIVGPNSLVVGCAEPSPDVMRSLSSGAGMGVTLPAILVERVLNDPFQLWSMSRDGKLTNKAGFILEVLLGIVIVICDCDYDCCCDCCCDSWLCVCVCFHFFSPFLYPSRLIRLPVSWLSSSVAYLVFVMR